jgi:hypothetical protein
MSDKSHVYACGELIEGQYHHLLEMIIAGEPKRDVVRAFDKLEYTCVAGRQIADEFTAGTLVANPEVSVVNRAQLLAKLHEIKTHWQSLLMTAGQALTDFGIVQSYEHRKLH